MRAQARLVVVVLLLLLLLLQLQLQLLLGGPRNLCPRRRRAAAGGGVRPIVPPCEKQGELTAGRSSAGVAAVAVGRCPSPGAASSANSGSPAQRVCPDALDIQNARDE